MKVDVLLGLQWGDEGKGKVVDVLSDAQRDIEQNVNSKMVFFDLSLKTIMLMKQ